MISGKDHEACRRCGYSEVIHAQDGWGFRGCKRPPLKGRMVAEIPECEIREKIKAQMDEEGKALFPWD